MTKTLREVNSWSPFSTDNMFSIFASPKNSFTSYGIFALSFKSLFSAKCFNIVSEETTHENLSFHTKQPIMMIIDNCNCSKPSESSSFAICPAAITTSSGRGASDDQYSYLSAAISEWTPARNFNLNHQKSACENLEPILLSICWQQTDL